MRQQRLKFGKGSQQRPDRGREWDGASSGRSSGAKHRKPAYRGGKRS